MCGALWQPWTAFLRCIAATTEVMFTVYSDSRNRLDQKSQVFIV